LSCSEVVRDAASSPRAPGVSAVAPLVTEARASTSFTGRPAGYVAAEWSVLLRERPATYDCTRCGRGPIGSE